MSSSNYIPILILGFLQFFAVEERHVNVDVINKGKRMLK